MRKSRSTSRSKPRSPPKFPRGKKSHEDEVHQATIDEFDKEGMGVAPKE